MAYPKVTITEHIEGPRPVRSRSLARVAGVGTSKKGSYNKFILMMADEEIDSKIGRTLDTGSVGMQCASDEGASTDMGFVRVMGAARKASKTFNLAGTATGVDTATLTIVDGDSVAYTFTSAVTAGSTAAQIVSELANKVNSNSDSDTATELVCPVNATVVDGTTMLLEADAAGAAGNAIQFSLAILEANGLTLTGASNTNTNLNGGFDGPKAAEKTTGDIKLVAASEGPLVIDYKWSAGKAAGTYDLELKDDEGNVENYTLSFAAGELVNGNEFAKLRTSAIARAHFVGTDLATAVPPTLEAGSLEGGSVGAPITEDDYLNALRVLAKANVNVIFAPGQVSDNIRAALLAQAENSTILGGLRVAVLNADKGLQVEAAKDAATGYDTATGSAVMVAGWCTYAGQPRLEELSVSPDGFYAGHLAATPLHVSPSARSSSPYFKTVVAVDTESNETAFEEYTNGRLEAIVLDPSTGGYHCLNGRTLSSDSAMYYMCVRRKANQIKTDIYFASQTLKSEPKSGSLLDAIAGMVNGYLGEQALKGEINEGGLRSIRKTATGVRTDFDWYPVYPADEIDYGMYRQAMDV